MEPGVAENKYGPHMAELPAYRALSDAAVRMLAFIQCEIAHCRAWDGELPLAQDDFAAVGIQRQSIMKASSELSALGFVTVKPGNAGKPDRYGLVPASSSGSWAQIKTRKNAKEIAANPARIRKGPER